MKTKILLLLTLHFSLLISLVLAAQSFPKASGRVNDFANVIDPAVEAALDQRIDQLEQQTSSEIAVATVPSLDGMEVEDYANKLFKEWGVGQASQDNGVLILVAPNERAMRIEVGYGLEAVLPDGLAGQIVREDFLPRFRDDDYSGGIRDGVTHVVEVVEKHQVLTAEDIARLNDANNAATSEKVPYWIILPFFGLFVTIGFGMLGIGFRTKTIFPVLFGGLFGGMPLLMSLAFIGSVSLFTLVPWGLAMLLAGWRLGGRPSWASSFRDTGSGKGRSGGWTMGTSSGSSSGSHSSSSSSSSSSSFGGGSSGGGGASGRW
jgi:uncharacterized protein